MKYVFLAVFIVSTAVHLYASIRKDTRMRNISKPFILLSLLGFYVLAARSVSAAIVLALIFSWIGDVLLIPKGVKWFTAGGIAFVSFSPMLNGKPRTRPASFSACFDLIVP